MSADRRCRVPIPLRLHTMAIGARMRHLLVFMVFVMALVVNSEADGTLGDVHSGLSAIDGINNDEVCTLHGCCVRCFVLALVGVLLALHFRCLG